VPAVVRRFSDVVTQAMTARGPVRLVGVDGCGGAGKTTFAERLSLAAGGCPVVHTDDFASFEQPTEGWPRLLAEVIEPLSRNGVAAFHPYDWVARRLDPALTVVDPAPLVIVEGVGAIRAAWRDTLALRVWVETPRPLRLTRGLERDGDHMADFWLWWMEAEDRYVDTERPQVHADLVVDGAPSTAHDNGREFVQIVVSAPR
jgi:uridine kinase